mmetsp:Transcript_59916/g.177655  ORF Transcript_59916/g.177655 Transcript_59916/m.177655 type:complete len:469 (-) Transcript_59916:350-1756(-)
MQYVRPRHGQYAVDPLYLVPAPQQISHGAHDRQSSPHRHLPQILRGQLPAGALGPTHVAPQFSRTGQSGIVRRDDVHVGIEPGGMEPTDALLGRAVEDYGMRDLVGADVTGYGGDVPRDQGGDAVVLLGGIGGGGYDAGARRGIVRRARDGIGRRRRVPPRPPPNERDQLLPRPVLRHGPHPQIDVEGLPECTPLSLQQSQQAPSQFSHPHDADVHGGTGQTERRVDGPQRPGRILAADHRGDVPLGASLRNGQDVDLGVPQRREESTGDARGPGHAVPHRGDDGARRSDVHGRDVIEVQFLGEFFLDGFPGLRGSVGGGGERDGMLRRRLGDERDAHPRGFQRAEQPPGDALHADQSGPLDVDQRHAFDGAEAAHASIGIGRGRGRAGQVDARSAEGRIEGVSYVDGYLRIGRDGGSHGLGMYDLRSEVRQFHRLVVRDVGNDVSARDAPRIGRQHTVDVGPYRNEA